MKNKIIKFEVTKTILAVLVFTHVTMDPGAPAQSCCQVLDVKIIMGDEAHQVNDRYNELFVR